MPSNREVPEKRDAQEPGDSARHYRMLFDSMAEGFAVCEVIFDGDGVPYDYRFLEVNPAFKALIGPLAADLVGKTALEVWPDVEKAWIERYFAVALTGVPAQFEDYSAPIDKYFEVRAYSPEPGRFAFTFSDVTDRRRFEKNLVANEESLRQSQLLLRASIESQRGTLLFSIDREYRYLFFNQAHTDAMRAAYGTEPALGLCILDLITAEEDMAPSLENYNRAFTGESHSNVREFGEIQKSYFESYFNPIINEEGTIIGATAMARDISERYAAEVALKESESRHRTILEAATDGFLLVDADGQLLEVNEAYSQMSGYSIEELLSMRVSDLEAVETADEVEAHIRRMAERGSARFESQHRRKDGTLIDIEVSSRHGSSGSTLLSVFIKDITESKRAEALVHASEEKFRYLFDNSTVAKSLTRPNGEIEVNRAFCEMLGYTRDELVAGTMWQQLTHPDDVEASATIVASVLRGEASSARFVKRYIRKDGGIIWADVSTALRRTDDGEPEYFMTTILDISDRVAAEEDLKDRERWLNESQRIAGLGHYVFDIEADRWSGSPMLYEVLGTTGGGGLEEWRATIHPADRPRMVAYFQEEVLSGRQPFNAEYRIVRATDSAERWVHGLGTVDYHEDGHPLTMFGVIQDVTERRLIENEIIALNTSLERRVQERTEELAATNEELLTANAELNDTNITLEDATRAKSDFLASMSHELRTPLNSIIGFSDILAKGLAGELNAEQEKQVGMINNSGRHLLGLVNEVLDLAKIESGAIKPSVHEVDVSDVARRMFDSVRPMAEDKGLEMHCDCDVRTPLIETDDVHVGQILLNLMGNAVKFTTEGHVRLSVIPTVLAVRIAVEDTGPGIPSGDLVRIFDEFYQVREQGVVVDGTGLGLAVSRRLAEALGARIEVASTLGEGSTFTLVLPARLK